MTTCAAALVTDQILQCVRGDDNLTSTFGHERNPWLSKFFLIRRLSQGGLASLPSGPWWGGARERLNLTPATRAKITPWADEFLGVRSTNTSRHYKALADFPEPWDGEAGSGEGQR
jgi:hypothetical protein